MLARQIKADIEAMLPADLGRFARLANAFRARVRRSPRDWRAESFGGTRSNQSAWWRRTQMR